MLLDVHTTSHDCFLLKLKLSSSFFVLFFLMSWSSLSSPLIIVVRNWPVCYNVLSGTVDRKHALFQKEIGLSEIFFLSCKVNFLRLNFLKQICKNRKSLATNLFVLQVFFAVERVAGLDGQTIFGLILNGILLLSRRRSLSFSFMAFLETGIFLLYENWEYCKYFAKLLDQSVLNWSISFKEALRCTIAFLGLPIL